jgi:hypothetical protein
VVENNKFDGIFHCSYKAIINIFPSILATSLLWVGNKCAPNAFRFSFQNYLFCFMLIPNFIEIVKDTTCYCHLCCFIDSRIEMFQDSPST